MPSQILITMDDLETAVRLNAAFEAAKLSTAMFSSLDDVRASVRDNRPGGLGTAQPQAGLEV
jgi:signal transduction histidine kinase